MPHQSRDLEERKLKGKTTDDTHSPLHCFDNFWWECFFDHHELTGKDDISAADAKRSLGCVDDDLTIFLDISDGYGCPREADAVKKYCEACRDIREVREDSGEERQDLAIWIDERNSPELAGKGNVRFCGRLSTSSWLKHLEKPVRIT